MSPERRLRPRTRTTSGSASAPVPKRKRQAKKPSSSAKEPAKEPPKEHFDVKKAARLCATSSKAGLPTREEYEQVEQAYLDSLSSRKREKALLTQAMFDDVWDVLHNPRDSKLRTPQFRFWVRKMFVLSYANQDPNEDGANAHRSEEDLQPVILHEDRPVALREQIYDIVSYFHRVSGHGGRDKTMAHVRERYSWIPKELIAQYVKICPTCVQKKTKGRSASPVSEHTIPAIAGSESTRWADGSDSMDTDDLQFDAAANRTPRCYQVFPPLATPIRSGGRRRMQDTLALPPLVPRNSSSGSGLPTPSGSGHEEYNSRGWLSGLTALPGPNTAHGFSGPQARPTDLTLPPMRRAGSENDTAPIRSRTGVTLPPLMKTLSEEGTSMSQTLMYPPLNALDSHLKGALPPQYFGSSSGSGPSSLSSSGTGSDHGSLATAESYHRGSEDHGYPLDMDLDMDIDPVLLGATAQSQPGQLQPLDQANDKSLIEAGYAWDIAMSHDLANTRVDYLFDALPTVTPVSAPAGMALSLAMRPVVDATPVKMPHRTLIDVPIPMPLAAPATMEVSNDTMTVAMSDVAPMPMPVVASDSDVDLFKFDLNKSGAQEASMQAAVSRGSGLLSQAGSIHTIPTGANGSSGSLDAQDWEAQYCLEESPR